MVNTQNQGSKWGIEDALKKVGERIEHVAANGVNVDSARALLVDASGKKSFVLAFRAQTACDKAECTANLDWIEAELAVAEIPSANAIKDAIAAARTVLATPEPTHRDRREAAYLRRQYSNSIKELNIQVRIKLRRQVEDAIELQELGAKISESVAAIRHDLLDERLAAQFSARFQRLTGAVDETNLGSMRRRNQELANLLVEVERRDSDLDTVDRLAAAGITLSLTGTVNFDTEPEEDNVRNGNNRGRSLAEQHARKATKAEKDRQLRSTMKGGAGNGKKKQHAA